MNTRTFGIDAHAWRRGRRACASFAAILTLAFTAQAGWIAYNDSAYKDGQTNAPNVTTFGLGRSFAGEGNTGLLRNFATGTPTAVTATYEEHISTGSVNSAGDSAPYVAGTDAQALFEGKVDWVGNMSYGDSPGWWVDLTFSGLDPNKRYTFVGTVDRAGGAAYADRVTNWKLMGADSFVYASSPGARKVADDSVEFSTGSNPAGYVARWTDVRAGADGTVVIRTSHTVGEAAGGIPGAHAYKGYAGGVFLLAEQEENWEAFNDSAFKAGQVEADNVTTFGLGRSFEGEGSTGNLKVLTTGADSLVMATFVEHFSTGSVNSAGDAATYTPGSDAEAVFAGKVDLAGNMSYGDSPGWYVDLILSGLDPNRRYTFAATANRNGGAGYADRVTNWKLIGADTFTYAASTGARKVADDSVEFSTGENGAGYVARWTDIAPGSDGQIVIRTSHTVGEANGGLPGAHAYKGYAGGVFMLRMQPAGAFRWVACNDSAFKPGQTNADFVTTFGLGRSFAGSASTGELLNLATDKGSGVTATFTEHISTGSVNSAGDPATYVPGSDAEATFQGVIDLAGNMSYGDSPGWWVDLTFTGLNSAKRYTFAGTADRHGGTGYADRVTNWRILGAAAYTFASTKGTKKVAEDAVEFSTGDNAAGYVARWVNIQPADDGSFTIRTSHTVGEANGGLPGAHAYKGYAGGVFLLAEQLTAGGGGGDKPIEFASLVPAEGATNAYPNTPILAVLQHGDSSVKTASVKLRLDGIEVTPQLVPGSNSTTVSFQPTALFASKSVHSAQLSFADNAATPTAYAKDWTFTVLDYSTFPTLPASVAVPFDPAKYRERGFACKSPSPDQNEVPTIATIDHAQTAGDQAFNSLVDPAILNPRGYFIEPGTVNYQIDGNPIGNKAGDRRFPGIAGSGQPGEQFALQVFTLLRMKAGYYHWNITMQKGFRLMVGPAGNETEIPFTFTPCTNCGGDDGPWFTDFLVAQEGLYPFRLLFYNSGGSASLEWVDAAPTGLRYLINENATAAIAAYVPPSALPELPVLTITSSGNNVVIAWTADGTLQWAPEVSGPWTDLGNTNPYTAPITGARRFYRVR